MNPLRAVRGRHARLIPDRRQETHSTSIGRLQAVAVDDEARNALHPIKDKDTLRAPPLE
jgi:hypothetical protein